MLHLSPFLLFEKNEEGCETKMKHVKFEYQMNMDLEDVSDHYITLKCIPHSTCRQKITKLEVKAEPLTYKSEATDAFGNILLIGHELKPHNYFQVLLSGEADVNEGCYEEEEAEYWKIYEYASAYTQMGPALEQAYCEWREERGSENTTNIDIAWTLMRYFDKNFTYKSNVTNIETTAEEAMKTKEGVCQDFAHCFLALLRKEKIPARYVVGMMSGEGLSHAWVEVWDSGKWFGFDPTNHKAITEEYIKISHGRDYADCIVSKGIFCGSSKQEHDIKVVVQEQE